MLQKLLQYSGKILVTIMVVLLILSFALWGIGDVLKGGGSDTVATVGELEVSEGEFRKLMKQEVDKLRASFGDAVSPELIRSFKIEKRVIGQLVNDRLLTLVTDEMNVRIGDEPALKEIASVPQFRTEDGSFDSAAFEAFLSRQRESEAAFMAQLKNSLARKALMDSLTANPIVSETVVNRVYKFDNEKRKAKLLIIPEDYITNVREPQESELIEFYEKVKGQFAAPEYRNFSYIVLDSNNVDEDSEVTEEDIKIAYEERLADFTVPEKREILHIILDDGKTAKIVHSELKEGKDFYVVAKDYAAQEKDETNLGYSSKQDLIDEISPVAFRLSKGEYSDPIESSLGWHIVKINNIKSVQVQPLSKVKAKLKEELLSSKADEIIYTLSTSLEDALAGGATLEEVASDLNLKLKISGAVDEKGGPKSTTQKVDIPAYENFLPTAFESQEGVESYLERSPDGKAYFIVRVDEIIPARSKALDEVKGKVVQEWKEQTKKDLISLIAKGAAEKLSNKDSNFANVKKEISKGTEETKEKKAKVKGGIKIKDSGEITRFSKTETDIPASMIAELFSLEEGDSTGNHKSGSGAQIVGRLTKISVPDTPDAMKLSDTRLGLKYSFADDVWEQYLTYLRFKYPVKVFEEKITSE